MKCSKCDTEIQPGINFCPNCGERNAENAQCGKCGADLPDGVKFCPNCGESRDGGASVKAASANAGQRSYDGGVELHNVTDNGNMKLLENLGCFSVYEHQKDLSCESNPSLSYFMHKMNVRKRQVLIKLNGNAIKMQAGAMQWISGAVECETGLGSGVSAVGNFLKGAVKGMVTGEQAVKPRYSGNGHVMLEPTYKHILCEEVSSWGEKGIVIQDGMFLACDADLEEKVVARKKLSSLLAREGLFNLSFCGKGTLLLESPVPRDELFEFELKDSVLKIDGNMAIAWSGTLEMTVERSSKTWLGSKVNGEGSVNVFRGTGKIWMTPTEPGTTMEGGDPSQAEGAPASKSVLGSLAKVASAVTD